MSWFWRKPAKHKHRWLPTAVKHGIVDGADIAGTQILQMCQDADCGAYATQTIFGIWELEDVREQMPAAEVAELRRMTGMK